MENINKLKRFKKTLPCLEDRMQYIRICKKCNKDYRTFFKYSEICGNCSKSARYQGVPLDLKNKVYKIK